MSVENEILPENYKILHRHFRKLKDEQRKDRTLINHFMVLIRFSKWLKVEFKEMTEDDLNNFWDNLDNLKPATVRHYKNTIKSFLGSVNQPLASKIKVRRVQNSITPDQLLTDDEIDTVIKCAVSARDKALFACLADSGARIGELLSTTIADAKFDNYGCLLWLRKSKTDPRPARLIFASSYLRSWLEVHPRKNELDAPIFCSFKAPYNGISRTGLYEQISRIGQRVGIKKKITPHNFRHTRATFLATKITEQQLKCALGWKQNSTMTSIYVHLSAKDIDTAFLEAAGIKKEEVSEEEMLKTIRCPRCRDNQPANALYCNRCGFEINEDYGKRIDNDFQKATAKTIDFNDPDIKAQLLKFLMENQ